MQQSKQKIINTHAFLSKNLFFFFEHSTDYLDILFRFFTIWAELQETNEARIHQCKQYKYFSLNIILFWDKLEKYILKNQDALHTCMWLKNLLINTIVFKYWKLEFLICLIFFSICYNLNFYTTFWYLIFAFVKKKSSHVKFYRSTSTKSSLNRVTVNLFFIVRFCINVIYLIWCYSYRRLEIFNIYKSL